MRWKRNSGLTLIELIISMAVVLIVISAAGLALHQAVEAYSVDKQLQDDQYYARMALLSITREIHRGIDVAKLDADSVGNNKLILHIPDEEGLVNRGGTVTYGITDNILTRVVKDKNGITQDSPVSFPSAKISGFTTALGKKDPNDSSSFIDTNRFLTITLVCLGESSAPAADPGTTLETCISVSRVPTS